MPEGKQLFTDEAPHAAVVHGNGGSVFHGGGHRIYCCENDRDFKVANRLNPVINQASDKNHSLDSVLLCHAQRRFKLIRFFINVFGDKEIGQGSSTI